MSNHSHVFRATVVRVLIISAFLSLLQVLVKMLYKKSIYLIIFSLFAFCYIIVKLAVVPMSRKKFEANKSCRLILRCATE